MQDISKSIEACAARYGEQATAMRDYLLAGQAAALALDNRGPIEFDASGKLAQHILDAYSTYGFYVFTGVLTEEECEDIEADMVALKASFPVAPDSTVDAEGRPALGSDSLTPHLVWSKPLGDPLGGTQLANGRHQVKMFEPEATADTPLGITVHFARLTSFLRCLLTDLRAPRITPRCGSHQRRGLCSLQ
jgi:hypothetical protein